MRILITGGAGFIGSHVAEELLCAGHEVDVVDDLTSGSLANLPPSLRGAVRQQRVLDFAEAPAPAEVVIHLAATPSVQTSWARPEAAHENNLTGTVRVLHWCRERRVRRVIFASSAAVYGHPCRVPIAEDHPTQPLSPYGLQKLASEGYGRLFAEKERFEFISLRLFNVYGPRQRADSAYAGVLARFVSAFAENRDITILGDGGQTRDFVAVSDVARAFRVACEIPLPDQALICNVGTGAASSLLDVVAALRELFPAWRGAVHFAPPATGDIRDSLAEVSRLRERLGVRAETPLTEGLRLLTEWLLDAP